MKGGFPIEKVKPHLVPHTSLGNLVFKQNVFRSLGSYILTLKSRVKLRLKARKTFELWQIKKKCWKHHAALEDNWHDQRFEGDLRVAV